MPKKSVKKKKTAKKKTALPSKLIKRLEEAGAKYEILEHKTVYTAIDAAATMKRKLDEIAKSLLVKAGKDYYLVLLPAGKNLDLAKLAKVIAKAEGSERKVTIPSEKVMENAFKVKAGAMGAFGSLYKLPVVMENSLAKAKKAVFSTGSFNHSVLMSLKDYAKMENPVFGSFGVKKKIKKTGSKK